MRPEPKRPWILALLALAAGLAVDAHGDEPRLLATRSSGAVPVGHERRLTIEGFRGDVYVRAGVDPEVRFMATRPGERDALLDVEVWLDGSTLSMRPPVGAEEPRTLEVAVPVSLAVRVVASGAKVTVNGLREELEVSGDDLALDLRSLGGPVSVELKGGSIDATGLQNDLTLRGQDFEGDLRQLLGLVDAAVSGAALRLERVGGDAEIDLEGGRLAVEGLRGRLSLQARNARVELRGLERGARLDLDGTPLGLSACQGEIDVETDAEVRFGEMKASLHVNSWGGAVTGSGNEGLLEVRTDGATVDVDKIVGPMRIQGERLDVRLADISGELGVYTAASQVTIDRAGGSVTIENEFGDVTVRRAAGDVAVNVRDGDVALSELSGSVELWAEAARVEVGWTSLRPDKDSRIENVRGDVVASFPPRGGASVEVRSNFGRVESELAELRVGDDGNTAAGVLGNRRRPHITVVAEGSVTLRGTEAGTGPED